MGTLRTQAPRTGNSRTIDALVGALAIDTRANGAGLKLNNRCASEIVLDLRTAPTLYGASSTPDNGRWNQ